VGLDTSAFESCLTSTEFNQKIGQDAQEAVALGGDGTPFSVVIAKDGTAIPVSGAQPYEIMTTVIDRALQ
jgi:predicted DsbA family dithiol-disulfide isomerase